MVKWSVTSKVDELDSFFGTLFSKRDFFQKGKVFHTSDNPYFYDTGTGKVLRLSEKVYFVLKLWESKQSYIPISSLMKEFSLDSEMVQQMNELKLLIEQENLLQAHDVEKFDSPHLHQLEQYVTSDLRLITLELTEKCNLRCSYCIYGESNHTFRGFGKKSMSFDTAKRAIDYAKLHAGNDFALTFYGGEPLLEFGLIKKCVEYTKQQLSDRNLTFSITTNMVLMNEEIAKYIASVDEFFVVCSMDGPREIHDEFRLFANGGGSYDYVYRGLETLVNVLGDSAKERISFSMVLNTPYSKQKFDAIQKFFIENPWIPQETEKNISYVSRGRDDEGKLISSEEHLINQEVSGNEESIYDPLGDWSNQKILENQENLRELFTSKRTTDDLYRIHNRSLTEEPVESYRFNGCCIPASRRLYVTVDGDFKLCERIGESPSIGDVTNGIDLDRIKSKYISAYMNESVKLCNRCWAVNLCGVCYTDSYDSENFRIDYKRSLCDSQRFLLERALVQYHEILEKNPESLRYLNDVIIE